RCLRIGLRRTGRSGAYLQSKAVRRSDVRVRRTALACGFVALTCSSLAPVVPAFFEERLQDGAALFLEHVPGHLEAVIQGGVLMRALGRFDGARLRFARA